MGLCSTATVSSIALACKLVLNLPGFAKVSVSGLHIFLDALRSDARQHGHGVITVANHISTLDDPVAWGVIPAHCYFRERTTRWALGASDIMFTNPLFSAFFRQGQVLETFRGRGIYQPAVDTAIEKLNGGAWVRCASLLGTRATLFAVSNAGPVLPLRRRYCGVKLNHISPQVHLFGEGKINQPNTYPVVNGVAHLPRFKWGVGRILMETQRPPTVIPMWLSGFDQLMPEGRAFPYKYLPRPGARLSVTFGTPLPQDSIRHALDILHDGSTLGRQVAYDDRYITRDPKTSVLPPEGEHAKGWVGGDVADSAGDSGSDRVYDELRNVGVARVRSEVTAIVQRAVEDLGRRVSGNLLGSGQR
ncbi:hypothetical protein HGRIS_009238 [Hohenbuehelia grisea]|uniref:Tafazzin family protein n=1 Tax=Hohenbuehelia grisea TaxID=104357 RepID=A0ABR3J0Y7_9AGAR